MITFNILHLILDWFNLKIERVEACVNFLEKFVEIIFLLLCHFFEDCVNFFFQFVLNVQCRISEQFLKNLLALSLYRFDQFFVFLLFIQLQTNSHENDVLKLRAPFTNIFVWKKAFFHSFNDLSKYVGQAIHSDGPIFHKILCQLPFILFELLGFTALRWLPNWFFCLLVFLCFLKNLILVLNKLYIAASRCWIG